jgi:N-acetylglucosamine-6-phosphate deacetylase
MTTIQGLDLNDGRAIRLTLDGLLIAAREEIEGPIDRGLPYLAPAFWDLQTNGRMGVSFSDPDVTPELAAATIRAHRALGVARLCPTLITAPFDAMRRGVAAIVAACGRAADVNRMVLGIHLEGPWISAVDGYCGAHPIGAVREADAADFERLQEAAEGMIRLVTLAPEVAGALELIRHLVSRGVVVSLGHTAADAETIGAAVDAGARMSTHLGNGIAATLARHGNPIWTQAADDHLMASVIADEHHLDPATLKVIARAKGLERLILVSDASPLAGLAPGRYGAWEVLPSGRVVVSGTPYLAGANQPLAVGLSNLMRATGWSLAEVVGTVTRNPARVLGLAPPGLEVGGSANVARVRLGDGWRIEIMDMLIDGEHVDIGN